MKSRFKVCGGYSHTVVLSENGDLFVFGDNNVGRLGIYPDLRTSCYKPIKLKLFDGVKSSESPVKVKTVHTSGGHTIFITGNS